MTIAPFVELGFNPTDLRPRDLASSGMFLGAPADAIEAALAVTRAAMVDQMRNEVRGLSEPTQEHLLRLADLAWQGVFWKFRKISAPVMADAYLRAYAAAEAGDVPISVIYDLADKHAEKIGDYFHASSREALTEGFTTLVNRRIPAKAAADRVLDAYGLTNRQMRGYVSGSQQFNTPVTNVMPQSLKAKARDYIDKAFTTRIRKLSRQEEHNIDEQAKQFAWMWMQDKGRLSVEAQKMWLTAKDERVCPICGPLHGQKVGVNEQFKTKEGDFWTPGLHPNCRCSVRLIENRFSKRKGIFAKADFDPRMHPRGGDPENKGRFSRIGARPGSVIRSPIWDTLGVEEEEVKPEVETKPVLDIPGLDIAPQRAARGRGPLDMTEAKALDIPAPLDIPPDTRVLDIPGPKPVVLDIPAPDKKVLDLVLPVKAQGEGKANLAPESKYTQLASDDRPFFHVVHEGDYDNDMRLTLALVTDSMSEAQSIASEMRALKVDEILDIVTGSHRDKPVKVTGVDPETGRPMYGEVSPEAFEHALNQVADQAERGYTWEELDAADDYEDVIWFDLVTGHRVAEDNMYISMADIVNQSGAHPDEFVYRILEIHHGHGDDNLTRRKGEHKWELSGQYVEAGPSAPVPDTRGKEITVTPMKPY